MLRDRREVHFLGVALSNWAYMLKAQGLAEDAHLLADESVSLLEATSARLELVSALLVRAWARAYLGDLWAARADVERAATTAPQVSTIEIAYEGGEIEVSLGDVNRARAILATASDRMSPTTDVGEQALLVDIWIDLRVGDLSSAARKIDTLAFGTPRTTPAFEARRRCARAALAVLRRDPDASARASDASDFARNQAAWLWARYARLLQGLTADDTSWETIRGVAAEDPTLLSLAAEAIIARADELPPEGLAILRREAQARPERWRDPIRAHLAACRRSDYALAEVLAEIGLHEDVGLLRQVLRRNKGRADLARSLARRLAPVVFVEDLGRVRLHVGNRLVEGSEVRRKVLALLCYLLTRPRFASTRDEAVEALWPELDPASAINSLNQTVYFLRRVFEPGYVDDLSPGYVGQDSETVWLDPALVDSRSSRCREMVRGQFAADPEIAFALVAEYRARFALDFAYEDWAATHRDALHASFLRVVQHAIQHEIGRGRFDRAAEIAERALEVEPDAEELQLDLVRLYRITGAHAAAAERYAQYANGMRAMGLEPEAFDDLDSGAGLPRTRPR
jgi:DNA-binding SARP family transcriptional activator